MLSNAESVHTGFNTVWMRYTGALPLVGKPVLQALKDVKDVLPRSAAKGSAFEQVEAGPAHGAGLQDVLL